MCGITPFQGVSSWVSMNHWSHQTGSLLLSPPYSSHLSLSFLAASLYSLPPFPVTLQSPWGVWLGSARLISGVEEKANWESVLAVNLTREGREPAVATLPLQPSTSSRPPRTLTSSYLRQHVQTHTHMHTKTQQGSLYSGVQVFTAIKAHLT